jgi:hypothetical protein
MLLQVVWIVGGAYLWCTRQMASEGVVKEGMHEAAPAPAPRVRELASWAGCALHVIIKVPSRIDQ